MTKPKNRPLIVGAGFSGAVLARELAGAGLYPLVIDRRDHVAGNCHTQRDGETGVMEHVYGPHIFNTDDERVWNYVRRFCEMGPFVNRVKASTSKGVFSMPINLMTINQLFGKRFSPSEAREFVVSLGDRSIGEPQNFEEQALKFLGRKIYEEFFYGYTKKQWGCEPKELPASILKRLPIRFSYDDNYYSTKYQGIPKEGYSALICRILDHPNIELKLDTAWDPVMREEFAKIFFTGPLDEFYGYRHGRLGYRTVYWEKKRAKGDYQGNAVINYPGMEVPYTRIHEHKHFMPWENHEETIVFTEYSKETGASDIPYYPKRLPEDLAMLSKYREEAESDQGVFFLGRLATYRYMDMDDVIAEALDFAACYLRWARGDLQQRPVFAGGARIEMMGRPSQSIKSRELPMTKLPILVVLSSAHQLLYEKYFLPTLPQDAEVIFKDLGASTDDGAFLSAEWQEAMCAKIRHALNFCKESEEGRLFIVSDVDIQFFSSFEVGTFETYFDSLGCDLAFQKERMRPGDTEVNCGFYAGRNTASVRELLSAALGRIMNDEVKNEQVVINTLLKSIKVKHALLDTRFYARTHGFPPRRDIWMHHANWTTTIPQKIRQLDRVRRIVRGGFLSLRAESYMEHMDRVMGKKPSLSEILFAQRQFLSRLCTKPFLIP